MCVHCRHAGGIACVSPQVRTNTTTKQGDDQYTTAHAVAVLVGDAGIIKRVLQQGSESYYAVISLLHPPYPPKKEQKSENNPQDTSKHRITRCDICQSEQYQHLRSPPANQTHNSIPHTPPKKNKNQKTILKIQGNTASHGVTSANQNNTNISVAHQRTKHTMCAGTRWYITAYKVATVCAHKHQHTNQYTHASKGTRALVPQGFTVWDNVAGAADNNLREGAHGTDKPWGTAQQTVLHTCIYVRQMSVGTDNAGERGRDSMRVAGKRPR